MRSCRSLLPSRIPRKRRRLLSRRISRRQRQHASCPRRHQPQRWQLRHAQPRGQLNDAYGFRCTCRPTSRSSWTPRSTVARPPASAGEGRATILRSSAISSHGTFASSRAVFRCGRSSCGSTRDPRRKPYGQNAGKRLRCWPRPGDLQRKPPCFAPPGRPFSPIAGDLQRKSLASGPVMRPMLRSFRGDPQRKSALSWSPPLAVPPA